MPRATSSKAGAQMKTVIAFFHTASMEIAEVAFDLCRDALKTRRATAEKIREGQRKAAAPAKVVIPKGVVKAKKRKARKAATVAAPAAAAPKRKRGPRKPRVENLASAALPEPDSDPDLDLLDSSVDDQPSL